MTGAAETEEREPRSETTELCAKCRGEPRSVTTALEASDAGPTPAAESHNSGRPAGMGGGPGGGGGTGSPERVHMVGGDRGTSGAYVRAPEAEST